ncbi:rhomboid family intramembrane serine protease [Gorillibacterium timonense]|uniref:rhomboid family intramembrane serine protease n=1 Tax=Gorillibacterium timonense TaxID=1689269 RepID=UPI000A7D7D09|nr:rhomboid family intramembrane serine protease [Gorillibacterium timonense]
MKWSVNEGGLSFGLSCRKWVSLGAKFDIGSPNEYFGDTSIHPAKACSQTKGVNVMQFIRYESFRQYLKLYPITSLLIAINVVMYILMTIYGSSTSLPTLVHFGAMYKMDAASAAYLNLPTTPDVWRYVAAVFLHNGPYHLLFNMFNLLVFAPPLERTLGSIRYTLFYLLAGVLGNLASYALHSDVFFGVGASGAIYGIYAAYIFMSFFGANRLDPSSRQTVVTIVIIGVIYSFVVPNVDGYAHLGGFVAGFLLMSVLSKRPSLRS